ncbi:ribonuclease R, partial [bacterium]|nr:ribonuclease R [bacterium]
LKGRRYAHPHKTGYVTGRVKRHPDGFGFVIPDDGSDKDLYLAGKDFGNSLHGDRVLVRMKRKKWNGRITGSVEKILERERKTIIGRLEKISGVNYVKPENPKFPDEIIIPDSETNGSENGQVVFVEITHYPEGRHRVIYGKIIRVLGYPGDDEVEFLSTVYNFGLPFDFSKEAKREAKKIKLSLSTSELKDRVDLRDKMIFTIDGENAKDFDDAVSIEPSDGGYILGVHIADVAYYVKESTAIDKDAYDRGTSVYFPDRVIPMLPFELSNEICSLKPKEDRLTISVVMEFDSEGNIKNYKLFESIINSRYRMTYNDVFGIIVKKSPELCKKFADIVPSLMNMKALSAKLHKKRNDRKSLDFDLPEPEVIFNPKGELVGIVKSEHNAAHNLIEEFMLSANEVVAQYLTQKDIDILYRIHEDPDKDSLKDLSIFLKGLGIQSKQENPSFWIAEIIEKSEKHPLSHIINQTILRSMKKAVYSVVHKGHFGLALETYTHFTSPIRRYPDLIVHRILRRVLQNSKTCYISEEALSRMAENTTFCEIRADEAQRDVIALKRAQFMADKVGNEYEGIIISILPFGFFVELIDFFVEGLVHINTLDDDYYIYNEQAKALVGKVKSRKFMLGDIVKVLVSNVDIQRRITSFILPDLLLSRHSRGKPRRKETSKRKKKGKTSRTGLR